MSFDHIESPALKEFNSHCQGLLDFSTEHKDEAESDSALGNGSDRKSSPSLRGANSAASVASNSADIRIPDLSDSYTHVSAATPALSRETPKIVKAKTIRDLDCEECLRRIHSLSAGDNVYFRRGVLGMGLDAEPTKPGDYVEGRVICFSFDKLKRYVIDRNLGGVRVSQVYFRGSLSHVCGQKRLLAKAAKPWVCRKIS